MALTPAERAKRYRENRKPVTTVTENVTRVTEEQSIPVTTVTTTDPYSMLPSLPTDQLIAANKDICWADVMALDHAVIDEVYHLATRYDEDILLRLLRAAGYAKRMAA